jgi:hypothetical protein
VEFDMGFGRKAHIIAQSFDFATEQLRVAMAPVVLVNSRCSLLFFSSLDFFARLSDAFC